MINKGFFEIVDSNGGAKVFDYNHEHKILAYDSGCYVVLWDIDADKKVMLHPHDFTVSCIMFFGANQEYLLSIDNGLKPAIFISEWQSMTRLHQMYLPQPKKNRFVKNYVCNYSPTANLIILGENCADKYTFSIWEFKPDSLNLLLVNDEENPTNCKRIHFFENSPYVFFALAETRCIKYWKLDEKRLVLANRIHVKEDIIDTQVSPLTNFLLFLSQSGKLFIINSEGQYVSSIVHPELHFSAVSLYEDYLFLGTMEGETEIYQLSTLKLMKNMKLLRENVQNARNIIPVSQNSPSKHSSSLGHSTLSPKKEFSLKKNDQIKKIIVAKNHDLLLVLYKDKSLFCYDYTKNKIVCSVSGHGKKIQKINWSTGNKKTFISCANDRQIRIWNYIGDRWKSAQIQIPNEKYKAEPTLKNEIKTESENFGFQKKFKNFYKITAMDVDWQLEEIYVGDNKGNLMIFDIKTGRMKHSFPISGFKISSIAVSLNYVAITQSSGHTVVFDKNTNFEVSIKLEEAYVQQGTQAKCYKGVRLLETDKEMMFKKAADISKNSSIVILNKVKQINQGTLDSSHASLTKEVNSRKTSSIKAITVHNVNTLRLHQIHKSHNALTSVALVNYYLDGRIMDMQVHPSNDYLVVLASDGTVSIFKIANGDLKGRIEVNKYSRKITIDPSGLYVVVVSPAHLNKDTIDQHTRSYVRDSFTSLLKAGSVRGDEQSNRPQLGAQYNTEQSFVSIYEIGTGEFVGEVSKVSTATSLTFSSDGSFVVIGCHKGLMVVLGIDPGLRENIFEALDGMRKNPYFWNDYPFILNDKTKSKGNILSNEEPRKERRESNKLIQSDLLDTQILPAPNSNTKGQTTAEKLVSTDRGRKSPSSFLKQPNFIETSPGMKSISPIQANQTYNLKVISPTSNLQRSQELVSPAEKAVGRMGSPYIPAETDRKNEQLPMNPNVKDAEINTSFKYEKPPSRSGEKKDINKQITTDARKVEMVQPQQMSPNQINAQSTLPYQEKSGFKPKIYKDVVQQTSFIKGTEGDISYDSKELEQQLNPLRRQPISDQKNSNMHRNIRPDPVDIDDEDDSPDQIKPDPVDIDNSIQSHQERQPYRFYGEESHQQQRVPEYINYMQEQEVIKPRPNFLNKDPKEIQPSYSEVNDGGASDMFDDLSEFERRFKRPSRDISGHSNF